jgi:hypothetical protein
MTEHSDQPESEQPARAQEEAPPSEAPPSEAPAPEMGPSGRTKAPDLKTPSGPQRVMYSLFGPETRSGRFLRGLLRTLALIVGMFALGLLAAYFLLYRPAEQQLNGIRLQATQSASDLEQARQSLAKTRQDLFAVQTQTGQNQSRLEVEVARSQLLRAMNAITLAQMALQANNKAGVVKNLDTAQGYLQAIQPLLGKKDAQESSTLQALFILARNDLDRDPKLAVQDLERLQSELQRADSNLQK